VRQKAENGTEGIKERRTTTKRGREGGYWDKSK
jgi:hypothetical protein